MFHVNESWCVQPRLSFTRTGREAAAGRAGEAVTGNQGEEGLGAGVGDQVRGSALTLPCPPQTLLWEAHEVELQRQREAEKLERQLALPPAEQAATQVSPHLPTPPLLRVSPLPGP